MTQAPIRRAVLIGAILTTGCAKKAAQPGHWLSIGPARITVPASQGVGTYDAVGRLTAIAVNPTNPNVIYVGSAGQLGHEGSGVWRTTNGGQTWQPIADSLPTLSIGAITIDPTNVNRVYVVTADEGLFRSDDGGGKWTHLYGDLRIRTNTNEGDRVALLINPASPSVMYLTSDLGVLRSSDGGLSWPVSLGAGNATWLVMDSMNPDVLYAAILGKGIYKTTTGGSAGDASWKQQKQSPLPFDAAIRNDLGILLAISHPASAASEVVYALVPKDPVGPDRAYALYRTTDGTSWSTHYSCTQTLANRDCSFEVMGVDPVNWKSVYLGGPLFWVSQDGGDKFTKVPTVANDRQPASPHGDYWDLAVNPLNPATVYAASDGGFYVSSNHGLENTWTFKANGITNAEMYDIALANTQVRRAISGTQDNGNILYTGKVVWDHIPPTLTVGGDGAAVAIDSKDSSRFYAVFDNRGTPCVSLDGGGSFVDFSAGLRSSATGCGNNPVTNCAIWNMSFQLQIHPTKPETLLESCQSLWRSTTAMPPGNWDTTFTPPSGQKAVRSAVDPALDIYYTGTDLGRLYAAPGGAGWQPVFAHPDLLWMSDIEVDPNYTDRVFLAFAPQTIVDRNCVQKAGTRRVYELTREAPLPSLSMKVVDITTNLTAGLCVNALAVDPRVPRTIYAATNKGVYRAKRNAIGGSWVWASYNLGMPLADVRDLEVHAITGHLFAATFGRSAFEVMPDTVVSVGIDIKPGSFPNSIQMKGGGPIPIAILSSATFDALSEVNQQSLTFGPTGDEKSLSQCSNQGADVNGDGLPDQICHFLPSKTGFQLGDTQATLKGATIEGTPLTGSDAVTIVK